MTPHAEKEDTRKKAPRWFFLGKGSVPPKIDKDSPTVMAMATLAVDTHDRTYKILSN
jgi:hypothetical protein